MRRRFRRVKRYRDLPLLKLAVQRLAARPQPRGVSRFMRDIACITTTPRTYLSQPEPIYPLFSA